MTEGLPSHSGENERPNLIKEKRGLKVLRQLTNKEMGISADSVITTPEGFNYRGQNDPLAIRSLTELTLLQEDGTLAEEPTSIDILNIRLKPITEAQKEAYKKAVGSPIGRTEEQIKRASAIPIGSDHWLIAADESFTELVAEATTQSNELGKTPKELADFLLYFQDAESAAKKITGQTPDVYEFNGRTYISEKDIRRGYFPSPFQDGNVYATRETITCLDDGSQVTTPHSKAATWIYRMGFYGGGQADLDPKKIAEVAGFKPLPEDDPVIALVKDPNAEAIITNQEQLKRIDNLKQAEPSKDLLSAEHYTVAPDTTETLITYLHQLGRNIPDDIQARINTTAMQPQTLTIDDKNQSVIVDSLLNIPQQVPEVADTVLQNIVAIDLEEQDKYVAKDVVSKILRESIHETTTNHEYFSAILGKLKKNPEMMKLMHEQAYDLYRSAVTRYGKEENDEMFTKLQKTIDAAIPTFATSIVATLQTEGFPNALAMTTKDIIRAKPQIEEHRQDVQGLITKLGNATPPREVSAEQIGILFSLLRAVKEEPKHHYTPNESATLQAAGIAKEDIPYASTDPAASTKAEIDSLLNKNAAINRDRETVKEQLPQNLPEDTQAAVNRVLRFGISPMNYQFYAPTFIEALTTANQQRAANQEPVIIPDVVDAYIAASNPKWQEFLTSPYVTKRYDDTKQLYEPPIIVKLNEEALKEIPTINWKKTVQIGDNEIVITYPIPESQPILQQPIKISGEGLTTLSLDKQTNELRI